MDSKTFHSLTKEESRIKQQAIIYDELSETSEQDWDKLTEFMRKA